MISRRLAAMLLVAVTFAVPAFAEVQTAQTGMRGGSHAAPSGGAVHAPPGGGIGHGAPPSGYFRGGHFTAPNGQWAPHPSWTGGGAFTHWREGHWWRGTYAGRFGFWWIVGPDWYWYPEEVAAIPDPYTPPGMAPGYWYWCDAYQQYYPIVGACPSGWRAVAPQ